MNFLEILKIIQVIYLGFFVILFLYVLCGLAKIFWYEKKINDLYEDRDSLIMKARGGMVALMHKDTEMKIRDIKEYYSPCIEKDQRKRKFILDKLALIKK